MNSWYWQEGVLNCSLLSAWKHGFFTRSHSPQTPADLHKYLHKDSQAQGMVYRIKQIHGDIILNTDAIAPQPPYSEADALFATPHTLPPTPQSLWVCSADCVPVLVGDRALGSVAAIHAGWRGTAAGIVSKTIAKFLESGSQLSDLRIALGPAISGDSYQVTQQVAAQVLATISAQDIAVSSDDQSDRCRLDLRAVQQQQLIEMGIAEAQIAIAPYCTLKNSEHFFSYRRNCLENPKNIGNSPQVQWSGIAGIEL